MIAAACATCGATLLPFPQQVLGLLIWSIEAAAQATLAAFVVVGALRLVRVRLPIWKTIAVFNAFALGRVWS